MMMMMMPNRARLMATRQSTQDLADRLSSVLTKPVTDVTGLKAKYDFTLTYSTDGLASGGGMMLAAPPGGGRGGDHEFVPEGEAPETLFAAIQSQLGL